MKWGRDRGDSGSIPHLSGPENSWEGRGLHVARYAAVGLQGGGWQLRPLCASPPPPAPQMQWCCCGVERRGTGGVSHRAGGRVMGVRTGGWWPPPSFLTGNWLIAGIRMTGQKSDFDSSKLCNEEAIS